MSDYLVFAISEQGGKVMVRVCRRKSAEYPEGEIIVDAPLNDYEMRELHCALTDALHERLRIRQR